QDVALGQRRRPADAPAIDEGTVAAADVLDEVFAAVTEETGVLATDGQRVQVDAHVLLTADEQTIAVQREALAEVGAFDRHQREHVHLLPRMTARCQSRSANAECRIEECFSFCILHSALGSGHCFFSGNAGGGGPPSTASVGGWPKATNNWNCARSKPMT